jgi:nuclear receptor subfamily 1 group D protein 3
MTPSVQRVVEFAKRVPGFCEFSQDDQLILIKLGFFEVWLSYIAKTTTDLTLTFDDGTYLTRQQLEIMYDVSVCSLLLLSLTHAICDRTFVYISSDDDDKKNFFIFT